MLIGIIAAAFVVTASKPNTSRNGWPDSFASIGEQLYFTGRSSSGSRMVPNGGNHHMTMMGTGGCVDCHGADRKGGRLWPAFWQVALPLTADALAGDHAQDGHSHDAYTAEMLATAITDGIRPDGSILRQTMPKWKVSQADLDALTGFLMAH